MTKSQALLGVECSVTGRPWILRTESIGADALSINTISNRLMLDYAIDSVYARALALCVAGRGITPDGLDNYLNPTLKNLFPDPSTFIDMDRAVAAMLDALTADLKISVFADYDVDGATSAAQLVRWFRSMGRELDIYVPDRLTEGYGPSNAAFDTLKKHGADLIITVDCGAMAHSAIAYAASIGLNVIVIDHHLMREEPPKCLAVVNPNRPGCPSEQGNLAAAGVIFVTLAALNREAEKRGLFNSRQKPDILQWLDLAALGAICDVTALTGFNRALATQGLKIMSRLNNPGIKAVIDIAGGTKDGINLLGTFHSGFVIGPRINAGGRVGRSDLGVKLLSTDDAQEANILAKELDELNLLRREVEAEIFEQAISLSERYRLNSDQHQVAIIAAEGWHPGVIGIVAGRLKERWHKPVIVIGIDPITGIGKGSGRSVTGVNLGKFIGSAYEDGILLSGGGHAMAAGLAIQSDKIEAFRAYLSEKISAEIGAVLTPESVEADAVLSLKSLNRSYLELLKKLEPFGPGNVEPLWAISDLRIGYASAMKGGHIRCELIDQDGFKIKALCWRAEGSPIGDIILMPSAKVHAVVKLKADDYMGRNGVQLEIEDLALA